MIHFQCLKRASWFGYPAKILQLPTLWSAKWRCLVAECTQGDARWARRVHSCTNSLNSPAYPVWKTFAVPRFAVLYSLWAPEAAPTLPTQDFNTTSRLASPKYLPKQFEYIARDQFDCIDQAGRGIIKLIEVVGMSNLGALWNFKLKFLGGVSSDWRCLNCSR